MITGVVLMNPIKLDLTKLLGFRALKTKDALGAKQGAKLGGKAGTKP